jgi:OmpA-OmpF porin, OOP family
MTKKWLVAVVGAAAMTISVGALAQSTVPNFYIGAEVGRSDAGDENDTGIKILGGYQFHRNIAAEIGYGMLFDKGGVELNALELVAVGMFPLANQFSLLGKAGFARLDAKGPGGSDNSTEFTFGIGGQYDLNRNLGLRLQWQRYTTDGDDVDFLNLGVLWRF